MPGVDLAMLALYLPAAIMAITFHEAAHGFVAWKRGDPTAYMLGRVTFNPVSHIDPMGTIILPAMLMMAGLPMFGWAKPVPVNHRRLKSPRWDGALVSVAGIIANLGLAVFFTVVLKLTVEFGEGSRLAPTLAQFCMMAIQVNLVFAVFNALPIPPLDGYHFFSSFLPPRLSFKLARIEPYGLWIVMGGLVMLPWLAGRLGLPFNPLDALVIAPVVFARDTLFMLVGL